MRDLIVQLFIILFPLFLFQMFSEARSKATIFSKWTFFLICGTSILLCMMVPISILDGFHYDLHSIPLIIGVLYGGAGVGMGLFLLIVVSRIYMASNDLYLVLVGYAIVFPIILYQIKKFSSYSYRQRLKESTILGFNFSLVLIICSLLTIQLKQGVTITEDIIAFSLYFVLSNTLGLLIVVFLIEKSRENTSLARELQEAEKLRVVSQLAASIAHEVRNPLTVVRGFIQMMTKEKMDIGKMKIYGDIMITELDRAQMIITDYLSYARPQPDPNNQEQFDIKDQIVKSVNVMIPYALNQGVSFKNNIQQQLLIHAEKSKIEQVLVNFIKNSIEAMPKGGTIEIRAGRDKEDILIEIIDQGVGMSAEQLNQLGNPFFTTKEQGTGIGLMVCYRIIEALNGSIKVTSEIGKGTHFQIRIPAAK